MYMGVLGLQMLQAHHSLSHLQCLSTQLMPVPSGLHRLHQRLHCSIILGSISLPGPGPMSSAHPVYCQPVGGLNSLLLANGGFMLTRTGAPGLQPLLAAIVMFLAMQLRCA